MTDIKVFKREAVFIPIKGIPPKVLDRVKSKLSFKFYAGEGKACKTCDNLNERHNDICDKCAVYTGGYELATQVKVKEKKYLKIPVGSSPDILNYLDGQHVHTTVVDKSPRTEIKPIKFLATLKPEQEIAVAALETKKRGVLKAPPRSGKTVMATALVCRLQKKTLILASQRDWLMGFHETFVGSKTQEPMTNLKSSRIKLCKTFEDFEKHDICLATVQTFYSEKGEGLLRKIRDMFQIVIADEIHTAAADKYIRIMAKLNFDHGVGLSGTPSRKDGKFVLVDNVLGPMIHEVVVKGERPRIYLTKTKYTKSYKGQVPWTRMVSAIENDKDRLKLIAEMAVKDVEAGHLVMIPFSQRKPIDTLIKLINDKAGKRIAYPFTGGLKKTKTTNERDDTIQMAREYRLKVLVGTLKIMSTGINIPRASMLYEVCLSSNKQNAEQRMRRVLTPMDDKPQPGIRYFLDDMGVRRNCLRNEYFNVMLPKIKPIISEKDADSLKSYFNGKDNIRFEM
jgi:superfamily II DNA or RNA helicase